MKIQKVHVSRLKVPLNRTFITAIRQTNFIEDIFIRVIAGDIIGYGSAPATTAITGDTLDGLESAIGQAAILLKGIEINTFNDAAPILNGIRSSGARMALDMAIYDLLAKQAGQPLWRYLGAESNTPIVTDVSLSCGDIYQVENATQQALEKGFNVLKIKLGNDVKADIKLCQHLKKLLPNTIPLRLDANQGWSVSECLSFVEKIYPLDLNIELIEQPIYANDLVGMAKITQSIPYAVLADESVFSAEDARKVLDVGAANIINIKLAKSGGITEAFEILKVANGYGVECMTGCMMESPLGIAAAAHFTLVANIKKADLDPLDWVDLQYFSNWLDFSAPEIHLNEAKGIGYQV